MSTPTITARQLLAAVTPPCDSADHATPPPAVWTWTRHMPCCGHTVTHLLCQSCDTLARGAACQTGWWTCEGCSTQTFGRLIDWIRINPLRSPR